MTKNCEKCGCQEELARLKAQADVSRRSWLIVMCLSLLSVLCSITDRVLRWLQPKPKSVAVTMIGGGGGGGSGKLPSYSKEDVKRTHRLYRCITDPATVLVNKEVI